MTADNGSPPQQSCWSGFCIATVCDGVHHVDATGYTWSENRGDLYCPRCVAYHRPDLHDDSDC